MNAAVLLIVVAVALMVFMASFAGIVRRDKRRQARERNAAAVSRRTVEEMSEPELHQANETLKSARQIRRNAERVHGWLSAELDKLGGGDK